MVKLIGKKKTNIAVFISGVGSNLKSIANHFDKDKNINISLVISNNSKAPGLLYAKKYKIKKKVVNYRIKSNAEKIILKTLKNNKIDLICLAGFMKILSKNFIKKFKKPILNIHPSLLPKFKGLNTHKRVLKAKEKFSGCTVHIVTPSLDSGKIISQKKIKINKNDNFFTLQKRILKFEHALYPKTIKKFVANL